MSIALTALKLPSRGEFSGVLSDYCISCSISLDDFSRDITCTHVLE